MGLFVGFDLCSQQNNEEFLRAAPDVVVVRVHGGSLIDVFVVLNYGVRSANAIHCTALSSPLTLAYRPRSTFAHATSPTVRPANACSSAATNLSTAVVGNASLKIVATRRVREAAVHSQGNVDEIIIPMPMLMLVLKC